MLRLPPRRHLPLEILLGPQQTEVSGILGNLVVLLPPAEDFHVVLVSQGKNESFLIKLRPAGPAKNLVGARRIDDFHLARLPFEERRQHHAARRQVDAGGQRFGADADRKELLLEEVFHDAAIFGQHAGMMHAHAPLQDLLELRPRPFRPVVRRKCIGQPLLLPVRQQRLPLELLRHFPAAVAVEAEDECRRVAGLVAPFGHLFNLLVEQQVADPLKMERHLSLPPFHQLNAPLVTRLQPLAKLERVADRR